jgi:hypothetical protein
MMIGFEGQIKRERESLTVLNATKEVGGGRAVKER